MSAAPVITIDGPTASGKGTVAFNVAKRLGFHYLDSGALYRVMALLATRHSISPEDGGRLAGLARSLDLRFEGEQVFLEGEDVSQALRVEEIGQKASVVAAQPLVREALLQRQRDFRTEPGLVCDGRDMGTVVFPDANLKVFLTADVEIRAERRTKQLNEKGMSAIMADVVKELRIRDERDLSRAVAPLRPAADAKELDTSRLDVVEAIDTVLGWFRQWQSQQGSA